MATDIFIVTHAPDARWTEYCLRSIDKFARKFRQTIVLFPENEARVFGPICRAHRDVKPVGIRQSFDGHLAQNAVKTAPDTYSDADYFFHLDADCVLTAETTPLTATTDGKPDLWYLPYDEFSQPLYAGASSPWREIVAHALDYPVTVDTMRRFPIMYPRWLYDEVRKRIEFVHGVSFLEYVRTAPKLGKAWVGYCEFCTLGGWAYHQHPHLFNLRHFSTYNEKPPTVKQFWSHWLRKNPGHFENAIVPELERVTEGYKDGAS